jgi:hypothetical protein
VLDAEPRRVAPVEAAALAEDRLHAGVVVLRVEAEVDRADVVVPVVAPAGQGTRLLAHVVLGVRAAVGAEGEELHQLAPVVLVRRVLRVVGAREPEQHRGVARDLGDEGQERPEPVRPEEPVLLQHQAGRVDPIARGREPVVPHQRHALDERAARPHHPVEPPELVMAPRVVRGERAAAIVVRLRAPEALEARVGQRVDGGVEASLGEPLGFTGTRAETRTPKEPLGLRLAEAPVIHGKRHSVSIGPG